MAASRPPAVEKEKATIARPTIARVCAVRNTWAGISAPTVNPRRKVRTSRNTPPADCPSLSVTPLTRSRLPNINIPIRGTDLGTSKAAIRNTTIGKRITSNLETSRNCGFIYIARSCLVVSSFIIGG
ncbi:hypothetical protein ES703_125732 [subsurface metagenome]